MKISVTIIALNEEEKIADAIRSAAWADEVLVVDANSSDKTRENAEELGARVLINDWKGFSDQKQFAVDAAENDIIFSLDADERVSEELADEIALIKNTNERMPFDGYRMPRLSIYMGREIRHGGWYPDKQLRLFDRRKGRWNGRSIHESVAMDDGATVGELQRDLLHYSVSGPAEHARMIATRYAPMAARQMLESGKRTSIPTIAVAGTLVIIKDYFIKLGFLDGFAGLAIACLSAHHATLKHMILHELQKENGIDKR